MRRDPENGSAFEIQRAEHRQHVFKPERATVTAMRVQTVITQTDTETNGNPVQKRSDQEGLPREKKQSRKGSDMKKHHDGEG